jgi:hypothetical protein
MKKKLDALNTPIYNRYGGKSSIAPDKIYRDMSFDEYIKSLNLSGKNNS